MNILIADDKEDNIYLLECLLKGNGHSVKSAENGQAAFEMLEAGDFQMIISDILMPVMDGFQLCRKVRAEEKYSHVLFIIYTATYTGYQDEEFAHKIGADMFIQKPCEPEKLLGIIQELAEKYNPGRPLSDSSQLQEDDVLKLYNERLVRKLEQKMIQAENEVKARQIAEDSLSVSNRRLNMALASSGIGLWDCNIETGEIWFSSEWKKQLGYEDHEIQNRSEEWENRLHPEERESVLAAVNEYISGLRPVYDIEFRLLHKDGEYRWFSSRGKVVETEDKNRRFLGSHVNITERKKMEQKRKELEIQLYQAQKMESVGMLAGGVAHDFNNLLTVILNYTEMVMEEIGKQHPHYNPLEAVYQASLKATELTRQLLAFSRKQVLNTQIVDINKIIKGFEKLMRRLLREDIELSTVFSPSQLMVKVDTAQYEQVLMNLAVNARDAMPNGGKLVIETALVDLDNNFMDKKHDIAPGSYALMTVSDTGCGMSTEIMEHIFEPFFTTKETGKGTGLGLATAYGIIKQHGGYIWVYSEAGRGTTFKVYMPISSESPSQKDKTVKPKTLIKGTASVMIVEDDIRVLKLASQILSAQGYSIIETSSAEEAVTIAKEAKGPIHLLISDVIMPVMKGPEVFEKIREFHPEIRALFMSGYTHDIISRQGILKEGIEFIQKPFTVNGLAEKVAAVLSRGSVSGSA